MRRTLIAALLATTCLTKPAHAGPVVLFAQGLWAGLTGAVAGFSSGAFGFGAGIGSWLTGGSFLSRIVMSVGLSALSQALMPKPRLPAPSETLVNYAQAVTPVEWVYGRVRKGGPFALSAYSRAAWSVEIFGPSSATITAGGHARRHYGIVMACHSTLGPVVHFLDKWQVETDAEGLVTTDPVDGRCRIRAHTGQAGQIADPIWRAVFPEVGEADDFRGLSIAALYAERPGDPDFARIYPSAREWTYAPVWDGCDTVYDPRTDSRGWSDNAALVIADVATRIYGKEVDWAEVAEQADISDQIVANGDGGTQRRWTVNTVIRGDMTWETARAHLQMCCDAFFYERPDGRLGIRVGAYEEPELVLTADDFVSLNARHKSESPDQVGSWAMRYTEPARDWQEEVSGAVVVDDHGPRAEEECYGIDSHNQAWRAIYRWSRTARPEWVISATLKYIGRSVMGRRFVRVRHPDLGLDAVVEVGLLARNAGSHTWQLEGVSVEPGDFDPDALALEPPRTLRATIVEDGTVPPLPSLSATVVEGTGGVALIDYAWPAQTDDLRQQLRVRSTDAGLPEWQLIDVPSGQATYVLTGLVDSAVYEAQIRNRTPASRLSTWMPEVPVATEAVANSAPPGAMHEFGGAAAGSSVALTFRAPNDPVYAAARIWRATDSTDFAVAALVRIEFGAPNMTDSWTDVAPGVGAHSYWIEPVNGSGIPGPRSGPLTVTII